MTKVAIYIRVSTTYQVDKDSLPMQRKDLLAYASLMLNCTDCVIFEDAGYSGKNTDRPQFQAMMTRIRQKEFSHVLVWKIDRISRNLLDFAEMYAEFKKLGVVFVSKNEQFDTSTAMGEAMLKIILVFAELERNMTSERVTATMISRASNGQWNGGRVPYGYNYDKESGVFSINKSEADIVIKIHELYLKNHSIISTARILNEQGYLTRAGNQFSHVSVAIILRNIWYCGDYQYNTLKGGCRQTVKDEKEWVIIRDHHPALVSRDDKEEIIEALKDNRKLIPAHDIYYNQKFPHVFKGLVFCGSCGSKCSVSTERKSGVKISRYRCYLRNRTPSACDNKSVNDLMLGEFVFNYVSNLMKAQKTALSIKTLPQLESMLLSGGTFNYISHIETEGLQQVFKLIHSPHSTNYVFMTDIDDTEKDPNVDAIDTLKSERHKIERAIDRLSKLYLYSDNAMSESDFIIKKSQMTKNIDAIDEKIKLLSDSKWNDSISDNEFIKLASDFIIAQNLADRNFVSYERIIHTIDNVTLKSFVTSIIDRITFKEGKVNSIIFRNGLAQYFTYK